MFSIIVPVYNAEKYIRECIDSVLKQAYACWELILVNDGSTDESLSICKSYESDSRIHVYSKENEGLSATRNFGMAHAKGEYVMFLDSDDCIEPCSLERFEKIIRETGVEVIAGYANHFDESGVKRKSRDYLGLNGVIVDGVRFYEMSLYSGNVRACAPYYVTKRELIERAHLHFEVGLLHEDEIWTPIMLANAASVYDDECCFYNYRISNSASITGNPKLKSRRAIDRVKAALILDRYFSSHEATENSTAFLDNIAAQYMYAVYDGSLYANSEVDVDRLFPIKRARTLTYRLKALLFAASPRVACFARGRKL